MTSHCSNPIPLLLLPDEQREVILCDSDVYWDSLAIEFYAQGCDIFHMCACVTVCPICCGVPLHLACRADDARCARGMSDHVEDINAT